MAITFIKTLYHNTIIGQSIRHCYNWCKYHIVPKKFILKMRFQKKHERKLDLKNPITLNEKIIWLKLYNHSPLHTQCADKFAVRKYVKEKVGDQYLVPLFYSTLNPKDIVPENLPNTAFIIKANHDSSGGIFVTDKNKINWLQVQKELNERMSKNYYWRSKERQYKNIKPRIIVEKLLQDKNGNIPFDYKLHCFNGKVRMIQVDMGRGTDHHYRNWYSVDWIREPYQWDMPNKDGGFTESSKYDIEKPQTLAKMIELSKTMAKDFCYVRVDWYDVDGELFFGELTFHHGGGNEPFTPKIWDEKLGSELKLGLQ